VSNYQKFKDQTITDLADKTTEILTKVVERILAAIIGATTMDIRIRAGTIKVNMSRDNKETSTSRETETTIPISIEAELIIPIRDLVLSKEKQ